MTPLTLAIVEGAAAAPPPAPAPRVEPLRRATTGSIEVPRSQPSAARILDRPPPMASYAEVEVTLEEKRTEATDAAPPVRPPPR